MFTLPAEDEESLEIGDDENELEYQPHRTDDPNIWGLLDIATRRRTEIPQTIYFISGDSTSKPIGLLNADGTFVMKTPTRVGNEFVFQDGGADDGQLVPKGRSLPGGHGLNALIPTSSTAMVVWDGAMKSPVIDIVEDGETFTTVEHSRGLILGDYSRNKAPEGFKSKLNASRTNSLVANDVQSTAYDQNKRNVRDPEWTDEVRGGSQRRHTTDYGFPEAA